MARPMPVLPDVPSMIVPPGFSSPAFSASSIIRTAIRSLIELPGLKVSTLANTVASMTPLVIELMRTIGVLPMASRILLQTFWAGGFDTAKSYRVHEKGRGCPRPRPNHTANLPADLQVAVHALHAVRGAGERHGAIRFGARRHGAVQRDHPATGVHVNLQTLHGGVGQELRLHR